jgi:hypothetical protein
MAQFWRRCAGAIVGALALLLAASVAPASAQDLYDRPVLAVDPGMHTSKIWSLAVDREGRFAVTGGADRTVRVWSASDGKLLQTIWIPVGPDPVGDIYAVAISPDGSTIAAGGYTENLNSPSPIYLFDRESGAMIGRLHYDLPNVVDFLTFSSDGRYLAATLGSDGLRVFDRNNDWREAFRDAYDGVSLGATFAGDGRLATTSSGSDGTIRLYDSNFHLVGKPVKAPSGNLPRRIVFSPDGRLLAVGYERVAAVDVLDGFTLERVPGPSPTNFAAGQAGLGEVAWSKDGRTLFAAGGTWDPLENALLAWTEMGRGEERKLTYCGQETAGGIAALPGGRILVASFLPCLGSMSATGERIWTAPSPLADFRFQADTLKVSADGKVVDFGFGDAAGTQLRFDLRSLGLSGGASSDGLTAAPKRVGLNIDGLRNGGYSPTLNGRPIPFEQYDMARGLAIAQDGKHFFLSSSFALAAFDGAGARKWQRRARDEAWAVNASKDGRVVVAAYGDGTIRWRRADDGTELLALQVLPNKTDWVLWTPEGFYEATPGAEDVLKWVVNHGPDSAATTLSVSAIPKLHRPDALKIVLDQLETARALGIADVAAARVDV